MDRQEVWAEPIYRNVWGLLEEFGDAELATVIAPRPLVVAYGRYPEVTGQKGDLKTPEFGRVQGEGEFRRIDRLLKPEFQQRELVRGETGSAAVLQPFLRMLGAVGPMAAPREAPADLRAQFDPGARQERQVRQLEAHVQRLVEGSEAVRSGRFLNKVMPEFADRTWNTRLRFPTVAPDHFIQAAKAYRESFWTEAMGKFDDPLLPPRPRARQIYSTPKWNGYEVVLDVWPDVFAWGILLVPNDLKPGERRPVVVCQHGRQACRRMRSRTMSTASLRRAWRTRALSPSRRTTCIAARTATGGCRAKRTGSRARCFLLSSDSTTRSCAGWAACRSWTRSGLRFTG
jgi:hypothetical protein